MQKLHLLVSSTVYGQEEVLDQIYAMLKGYGYEVWMSHKGTLPTTSKKSNLQNCLDAVEACDVFLGIITGRYGSGKDKRQRSITHQEMRLAIKLDKLRYFAVHHNVTIAREVLKQFRYTRSGNPRPPSYFKPNAILDDIRVLDVYDEAVRSDMPFAKRTGNWVQRYMTTKELLEFIDAQLRDPRRIRKVLTD